MLRVNNKTGEIPKNCGKREKKYSYAKNAHSMELNSDKSNIYKIYSKISDQY